MRRTTGTAVAVAWAALVALALLVAPPALAEGPPQPDQPPLVLRAALVPNAAATDVLSLSFLKSIEAFRRKFPHILPVQVSDMELPGGVTMDFAPLMRIAGDMPDHVVYVNFRQSETFIRNRLLFPLDRYIEKYVGLSIPDSHLLDLDAYVSRLRQSPVYQAELEERIPRQCWQVIRRECPLGLDCRYVKEWGGQTRRPPPARLVHAAGARGGGPLLPQRPLRRGGAARPPARNPG